jgi:hypothetical protein
MPTDNPVPHKDFAPAGRFTVVPPQDGQSWKVLDTTGEFKPVECNDEFEAIQEKTHMTQHGKSSTGEALKK